MTDLTFCMRRFLQLPFSRRAEAEADLIGLKLAVLAGYDAKVHRLDLGFKLMPSATRLSL